MLTEKDFAILENSLSNVFDWQSENLEKDFISFITSEIPSLPQEKVASLFKHFASLNPAQRDSLHFDLHRFIQSNLT